ncbi:WcaI family glycosyltransferase [Methylosinus sp. LW4]|uniref:WcaI family glycosyltransferase n=1 Tax=Methylosinus sp. LW4 TaxID=136993 RepID=UPI0003AB3F60|nr:WcaI family glycosyltransferase [Methylosinus sp. LW4]
MLSISILSKINILVLDWRQKARAPVNKPKTNTDQRRQKILVHAINFAPELIGCAKYTTELCQFLAAQGHNVEVVTAPPHYPGWVVRSPYRSWVYKREAFGPIQITRCPMVMKAGAHGFWRLLAPLSFAVAAAPIVTWRVFRFRPDVILCVEPTLFSVPIALIAAKLVRARSVLHVQDLEVDAAFEVGHLSGAGIRKIANHLERRLLDSFDQIVTISEKMREALLIKGLRSANVIVIRNWVNLDMICPLPRDLNAFRRFFGFSDQDFIVLYAGHVGVKQGLDVVLKAARRLAVRQAIHFIIVGDGPMLGELKQEFADIENVAYLPLQPNDQLSELLAMADLHVLPQLPGAADLVLPSKLGGMLASARLIAATAAPGTEIFNILQGVAILSAPGDDEGLAQSILSAHSRDFSANIARGLAVAETLSSARLLPNFERLLVGQTNASQNKGERFAKLANP